MKHGKVVTVNGRDWVFAYESEKEPERRERCETCECFDYSPMTNDGTCRAGPPKADFVWPRVKKKDWCLEWGRKR